MTPLKENSTLERKIYGGRKTKEMKDLACKEGKSRRKNKESEEAKFESITIMSQENVPMTGEPK